MPTRNQRRRESKPVRRGMHGRGASGWMGHLPVVAAGPALGVKWYRFQSAANTSVNTWIEAQDLINLFVVGTAGFTVACLNIAAKIIDCRVWCAPGVSTGPQSVSLQWAPISTGSGITSGPGLPSEERMDSTMSTADVAFVRFPPPKESLASQWISGQNPTRVLVVIASNQVTLDIKVNYILQNGTTPFTFTTIASPVAGQLYCRPLDQTASKVLQAIGFPTIV